MSGRDLQGTGDSEPWQLKMFRMTLKKRQKVKLLLEMARPVQDRRCLLVTNGDNNGAMNYRFREAGGRWRWAEMEADSIAAMEDLLQEGVAHATPEDLPFTDASFDRLVMIDVHEHLRDSESLNREIARVMAPGGLAVVTTPNGDPTLPLAVVKRAIGMGPDEYGHVRQGYRWEELEAMMRAVGLQPVQRGAYSRFFTELVELAINFAYVKLLSKSDEGPEVEKGTIAPSSEEQIRAVRKTYRLYSLIYPFVRAVSSLDAFIPGHGGYAVAVAAKKPE